MRCVSSSSLSLKPCPNPHLPKYLLLLLSLSSIESSNPPTKTNANAKTWRGVGKARWAPVAEAAERRIAGIGRGFPGIYDVKHFIKSLRYDVRIVESLHEFHSHGKNGKAKKMKAHQLRPPRDAPLSWYTTVALEKMKEHGAIYLTPFSHRLAEEIDNP